MVGVAVGGGYGRDKRRRRDGLGEPGVLRLGEPAGVDREEQIGGTVLALGG